MEGLTRWRPQFLVVASPNRYQVEGNQKKFLPSEFNSCHNPFRSEVAESRQKWKDSLKLRPWSPLVGSFRAMWTTKAG